MPVIGPRFRPVPSLAPLAAPEAELLEAFEPPPAPSAAPHPAALGFSEDQEPSRVSPNPQPRGSPVSGGPRIMSAGAGSAAAAATGSATTGAPLSGSHSPHRGLVGKLSINNWDVNPHQVARDLGVTK